MVSHHLHANLWITGTCKQLDFYLICWSKNLSSADLSPAGLRSVLGSPTFGIADYRDSFGEGTNVQVAFPRLSFHSSIISELPISYKTT